MSTILNSDGSGITRALWLFMVRQGGRWTGKQLKEALPDLNAVHVNGFLASMLDARQVSRVADPLTSHFKYGVTPECAPPRNITVAELYQALVLDHKDDSHAD